MTGRRPDRPTGRVPAGRSRGRPFVEEGHWYEKSRWLCVISFGSDCYPSDVHLCHGECKTFAGVTYALPRKSFQGGMQTVVDFLVAHPEEVVSVFLEDHVGAQQLGAALGRVRGLDQVLFAPTRGTCASGAGRG
ncbi:PI-PLC domain-containing protein [Streptomyces omiyaensis]|uniref:hypothetical protein n=1 Tax=Streptomyces omiyaensis TaxID=68247 RepID=UPI0036FD03BD